MKEYETVPWGKDGVALSFISGKYYGIMYRYVGGVKLNVINEDEVKLDFDYDIIVGSEDIEDEQDFIKVIGDILLEQIEESLAKNETVFTGGME